MNFSDALGYSFKGQNIPKILTIVLVFVILGVSIIVAGFAFESIAMLFLFFPLLIGFVLFLGGYAVSVIKSVMEGEEAMPAFAVGGNIGRGFMVMLAGIVYYIPFFVIFGCIFSIAGAGFSSTASSADEALGGSILLFCGMGVVGVVLGFITNYALTVGMVRYASEGRAGALFDFGTNFGTVMSNLGTTFGLAFRQIGLAIVFAIISSVLGGVISGIFGGAMNELAYLDDPAELLTLGMPIAIFFSLYYVVTMSISLMQSFSGAHLMAGYGLDLGLRKSKPKNDDTFDF